MIIWNPLKVMEYAEHDLKALMLRMGAGQDDRDVNAAAASATLSGAAVVPPSFKPFRVPEVKNLLRQLLEGLGLAVASPAEARAMLHLKGHDNVGF